MTVGLDGEVIGNAPEACALGVDPVTGSRAPNFYFSGECGEVIDLPTVCFSECTPCAIIEVPGCTDASADNYDPTATVRMTEVVLIVMHLLRY